MKAHKRRPAANQATQGGRYSLRERSLRWYRVTKPPPRGPSATTQYDRREGRLVEAVAEDRMIQAGMVSAVISGRILTGVVPLPSTIT